MKRKTGNLLMAAGAVLVGLALLLFLYNQWDSKRAEIAASDVMEQFKAEIQMAETGVDMAENAPVMEETERSETGAGAAEESQTLKAMEIDGNTYMGYLSIPSIGLELPVMTDWSYEGLKIAPGRYSGAPETKDLVIAGHNYARHFSPIKWLKTGSEIDFTDADNHRWTYQVSSVEQLNPDQVEEMISKEGDQPWDLTLFTCTTGGQMRYAVRCTETKNPY